MNKEQQRIKIAEACGYGGYIPLRNSLGKPNSLLPDYLNDLNAMHEAEKVLSERNHFLYASILAKLCGDVVNNNRTWYHLSTARQRAEAFLRTLNLWEI